MKTLSSNSHKITPTVSLRIGGVPEHFNLPWRLAIESGALKNAGVDASWTDFYSGTGAMVDALNNDEVDIATLLTEGAIAALTKNPEKPSEFELFSFYNKTPLVWGVYVPSQSNLFSLNDIVDSTFAISRYGSGSNLMAYLLAESLGQDTEQLQFEVINNLQGARELFKQGGNHVFLWEKFMTKPYVDNGEMRHIADFPTPWSCFITCVRKSVLAKYPKEINALMKTVLATAQELKQSAITPKLIASYYQLELEDVQTWLNATEWHHNIFMDHNLIQTVEKKLRELGIIQ